VCFFFQQPLGEAVLPPSPNWYLPQILDVANDGTVCWGGNTSLVVMSVIADKDKMLQVIKLDIIPHAHRERVSAVAFGPPGPCEKMIATIGGDGYVKVWDTHTGLMCQAHLKHGVSLYYLSSFYQSIKSGIPHLGINQCF
jgi:WD40 repeat protein